MCGVCRLWLWEDLTLCLNQLIIQVNAMVGVTVLLVGSSLLLIVWAFYRGKSSSFRASSDGTIDRPSYLHRWYPPPLPHRAGVCVFGLLVVRVHLQ
jgi:hypothetical protein